MDCQEFALLQNIPMDHGPIVTVVPSAEPAKNLGDELSPERKSVQRSPANSRPE